MTKKNILFVCKFNRFRSKVAEAYFKKINKNKNFNVKSAGLIKGSPLSPFQKGVAREMGISISGPTRGLSTKLFIWQDITIIVANDVPVSIFCGSRFDGKKIIRWKIPDVFNEDKNDTKKVISAIMENTQFLIKQLEKAK